MCDFIQGNDRLRSFARPQKLTMAFFFPFILVESASFKLWDGSTVKPELALRTTTLCRLKKSMWRVE